MNESNTTRPVTVKGMMCDHCRRAVRKLLAGYPCVTEVTQAGPDAFDVLGPLPDTLADDIEDPGYTLVS